MEEQAPSLGLLAKYWVFTFLILTTVTSSLLLAGDVRHWTLSKSIYDFITGNRASTQLVVQVCANSLGLVHVTIICVLVNYSTRLRLASVAISLDTLRFWTDLLSQQLDWKIPLRFLIPLLAFLGLCIVPSALWAGAITPISVTTFQQRMISLPSYSNTTLLNQNWTLRDHLPSIRTSKGLFTYSVGEGLLGPLLASASSATTIDGSVRQHAKIDFSRFTYSGRSYGVGASVGLIDGNILLDLLVTQYSFPEAGYAPMVTCIYNTSSNYFLSDSEQSLIWIASGFLPNSHPQEPEWSRYIGFKTDPIVAIEVATAPDAIGRMIGIASGSDFAMLNNTQCTIDFQPALFNITVDSIDRNITVTRIEAGANATDIEPSGMLTFLTTWQLQLISTDQTDLYFSLVGNSFNSSINDYITSAAGRTSDPPSEAGATLAGLGNSVTAMIDDILVGYASAQLMVASDTQTVPTLVGSQALRLGQGTYIIAITIFNGLIVLLVLEEAIRTRGWKGLVDFDYMDPRDLIIASSRGGKGIAVATDDRGLSGNTAEKRVKNLARDIGRIRIVQRGSQLVSVDLENQLKVKDYSDSTVCIGNLEEGTERLLRRVTV
jgi:hypothetical protein